jgi:hypothetical protein
MDKDCRGEKRENSTESAFRTQQLNLTKSFPRDFKKNHPARLYNKSHLFFSKK